MNYRGWNIRLALVDHKQFEALLTEFDALPWVDFQGRLLGLQFKKDSGDKMEFAKFGHYICRQTRGDHVMTQVLNLAHARHMMSQIQKGAA